MEIELYDVETNNVIEGSPNQDENNFKDEDMKCTIEYFFT